MRIISGKYKGRKLLDFDEKYIRPYTDRIKESIFSSIQYRVPGSRVLDLFAGSGNLGIEALSRGASFVLFNDQSRQSLGLIEKNVQKIGIPESDYFLSNLDAVDLINGRILDFDLVFLDPPFAFRFWDELWSAIQKNKWTNSPLFVFRYEKNINVDIPDEFAIIREKKYGKSIVIMMEI